MAWFKKNLWFVVICLAGLALLGLATLFALSQSDKGGVVALELADATQQYKDLNSKKELPGDQKNNNIEVAKQENIRLQDFSTRVTSYLAPANVPTNLNNLNFSVRLNESISKMRLEAARINVILPITNGYWFTFASQKSAVEYKGIANMAAQLYDIEGIVKILYDARVHSIAQLKRPPATPDEPNNGDFLTRNAKTNDSAIVTPYEVTFTGFSSELARVMQGLANATNCFVVRTVGVGQAGGPTSAKLTTIAPPPMMMNQFGGGRYGGDRYAGMMPQMAAGAAPKPKAPNALLDENKLRITLQLDSVRMQAAAKK